MKTSITTLSILLALNLCGQISFEEVTPKIESYVESLERMGNAGQLLVSIKGKVWSNGYGLADRERQEKFTSETISGTGSITKQFTGAAILKLEMMGKLSVDDLMSDYFDNVPADKSEMTLHHLLTHSAGFPGAIGDDYESISAEEFMDLAMKTPLLFSPGEKFEYSNVGYTILAILVEKLADKSYEQFLRDELFEPAGMWSTGYVLPQWTGKKMAVGYRKDKKWGTLYEKNWGKEGPYWHLKGNGGILSTPADMLRWHEALMSDEILSVDAKKKYYAKHMAEGPDAQSFYGYGWAIFPTSRGTNLITHNGGNGIFLADFLRYTAEDVVIYYTTNSVSPQNRDVAWEVAEMIFDSEYQATAEEPLLKPLSPEQEAIVNGFQKMLLGVDDQSIDDFVNAHFDQAMIDMAPMSQHRKILGRMRGDLKKTTFKETGASMDEVNIVYESERGSLTVLIVVMKGKVTGMGVED
jgi:CubicO group peptidase (beta-lactamase class C family)